MIVVMLLMIYIVTIDIIRYLIDEKQHWLMIVNGHIPRIWKRREKLFDCIAKVNYIVAVCFVLTFYFIATFGLM